MLATYNDAEFVAIYHYCRSVLVLQPFTGGFENLMTIYLKNAVAFAALKKQKVLFDPTQSSTSKKSEKDRKTDNAKLKAFLTKFIRLHGLLFEWATQMHRSHSQQDATAAAPYATVFTHLKANSAQAEGFGNDEINVDMYMSILHSTLEEYDQQLVQSTLSDQILVKLLVICIFSVHYGAERGNNILLSPSSVREESSSNSKAERAHSRSIPESLALITIFGIINK